MNKIIFTTYWHERHILERLLFISGLKYEQIYQNSANYYVVFEDKDEYRINNVLRTKKAYIRKEYRDHQSSPDVYEKYNKFNWENKCELPDQEWVNK